MLSPSPGHLPCVSGGKVVEASSRFHQGSSCETGQKQSSSGRFQLGSPGTSYWNPAKVSPSHHSHCGLYLWCREVQVCYLWYMVLRPWSERRAWLAYSSRLQGNDSSESRS